MCLLTLVFFNAEILSLLIHPAYFKDEASTEGETTRDEVGDRWSLLRASLDASYSQTSTSASRRKQNLVALRSSTAIARHNCDSDALKELHDVDRKSSLVQPRENEFRPLSERQPCSTHQSYVSISGVPSLAFISVIYKCASVQ
ncbi:unnamed protein product [Echinostoma caproni]|uniref:MADF domain-containing protein n=1 Tax=Echinostoma caproni TaxID=27848 RepID=A0A183BEX1_9TREM|nr:unnamed protein product [Echinostoma caproni]